MSEQKKFTQGPRTVRRFDEAQTVVLAENQLVCIFSGPDREANAKLDAAAPLMYEALEIEQALQMRGYTRATARALGPEAEYAYTYAGNHGLNNWRREKREAALRAARGEV